MGRRALAAGEGGLRDLPGVRRPLLAQARQERAAARVQPRAGARPRGHRGADPRGLQAGHAQLHALLLRHVPARDLVARARVRDHPRRGRADAAGHARLRPRRHRRAAAHGQLGPRGRLGRHPHRRRLHHRRRAAQAGEAVRALPALPRVHRHGGAPADRRQRHLRRADAAGALGRPGLPGGRARPDRARRAGRVLRRDHEAARRTRRAGRGHQGRPVPGHPLVRRDEPAREDLAGARGPGRGHQAAEDRQLCQRLADTFAEGIAAHPADWHMLQRLWLVDLDPEHAAAGRRAEAERCAQAASAPEPGIEAAPDPAASAGVEADGAR
jgi:hypothetical protein